MNGIQALFAWATYFSLFNIVKLLENGLAKTPPMGWMSWGYYRCGVNCVQNPAKCLDEKLILSVADSIYTNGYQEAGYEYIIIDDCWMEHSRGKDEKFVPDRKRFPHGMKYIADYIHARGLKFGLYTCIGRETCEHYPASKNHFRIDSLTFAEWGVDYVKVDGCFVGEADLNADYIKFGYYLNKTERPMVYSCSWPYYIQVLDKKPDWEAVAKHCNMWRIFHDVNPSWKSVRTIINFVEEMFVDLYPVHGPLQWNDPDMLIFGTGSLSENQSRVHLVAWVMFSAPLILSCDMNLLTDYEKRLLQNMDLIAINQDPLGVMAEPIHIGNHSTLWVKPHYPEKGDKYYAYSFALINLTPKKDIDVSFTPRNHGLNSLDGYTVLDVLNGIYIRNITISDTITVTIPAEDVLLYTMYAL